MEHLQELLKNLTKISFQDISSIPEQKQHLIAAQIEQLQDLLKNTIPSKNGEAHIA